MELLASLFKKGEKAEARERADEVVVKLQSALNELSRPISGASSGGRRAHSRRLRAPRADVAVAVTVVYAPPLFPPPQRAPSRCRRAPGPREGR